MIIIRPTYELSKKLETVNFETLSFVFSIIFDSIYKSKKKRDYIINVRLHQHDYHNYEWQPGQDVTIGMSRNNVINKSVFIKDFSHEFRHFCQDKIFRIPLTKKNYDETTHKTYIESPVEVDARKFEFNIGYKAIRLYNRLENFKKNIKTPSKYNGKRL